MKKFWGYTSNDKFSVGCTGQTVYLYDKDGNELCKFKDIIYAYTPMISPDGTFFIVKSTEEKLAIYSLETLSLVKKFRYSKLDIGQSEGFCFSADGKFFINIERHKSHLHSAISIYDTTDFSLFKRISFNDDIMLEYIEFDNDSNTYYLLGFNRNENHILKNGFIAKFENDSITDAINIPIKEHAFYRSYKHLEIMGFTEKSYEWSNIDCTLDELKLMNLSLAKLYKHYNK